MAPRPPIGTTAAGFDPRVADVPTAFARLVEVGGRPLSPPAARPWGNEATYVADPDGNVVAVARPPAR